MKYCRTNGSLIHQLSKFTSNAIHFTRGNGRVAIHNGVIVGILLWNRTYKQTPDQPKVLTICYVEVVPEFRRQGIATTLIKQCFTLNRNMDIYLHVDKQNLRAIKLYTSLGFVVIETLKNYYGEGADGYYMKRLAQV